MNLKKINLIMIIILFFLASILQLKPAAANPLDVIDVEGNIYELDGITPVQISVNVSITNLITGMHVDGMTSSTNPSHFKISIGGSTGDNAFFQVSNREYQNNKTITLGLIRNESLTLDMNIQNYAPDFTSSAQTSATQNTTYVYDIVAEDYNFDAVTLALIESPSGMVLSNSRITWTPIQSDVDNSPATVMLSATDGILTSYQNFTISVINANDPPVITSYQNIVGKKLSAYSYQVVVDDPDNDALSYGLSTKPSGMTISAAGLVSWTPSDEGSYLVILNVSDSQYVDTQEYLVFVGPQDNAAPTISSTPSQTAYVGTDYTYSVSASDTESNAMFYELFDSPYDAYIISNIIHWTPTSEDIGIARRFAVRVVDSAQSSAMQVFYVNTSSASPPVQSSSSSSQTSSSRQASGLSGTSISLYTNVSDQANDAQNSSVTLSAFGFKDSSEKNASKITYQFPTRTVSSVDSFFAQGIKSAPNLNLELLNQRPMELASPSTIIYKYFFLDFFGNQNIPAYSNIYFAMRKDYLSETKRSIDDVILLGYYGGSWQEIKAVFLSEDQDYVVFEARTQALGYFAIAIRDLVDMPYKAERIQFPSMNSSNFITLSGIVYSKDKHAQVDSMTEYSIINERTNQQNKGYTGIKDEDNTGGFTSQVDARIGDTLVFRIGSYSQTISVVNERMTDIKMYSDISPSIRSLSKELYRRYSFAGIAAILVVVSYLSLRVIRKRRIPKMN